MLHSMQIKVLLNWMFSWADRFKTILFQCMDISSHKSTHLSHAQLKGIYDAQTYILIFILNPFAVVKELNSKSLNL